MKPVSQTKPYNSENIGDCERKSTTMGSIGFSNQKWEKHDNKTLPSASDESNEISNPQSAKRGNWKCKPMTFSFDSNGGTINQSRKIAIMMDE